jgi:hypothetical protein
MRENDPHQKQIEWLTQQRRHLPIVALLYPNDRDWPEVPRLMDSVLLTRDPAAVLALRDKILKPYAD